MTEITAVLAKIKEPEGIKGLSGFYVGNPYYVTGNALQHAVAGKLPRKEKQNLSVSHGVFCNIYKQTRNRFKNDKGQMYSVEIDEPETLNDLFRWRTKPFEPYADQPWNNRQLDRHDTPDIYRHRTQNGTEYLLQKRRYIHFYCQGLQRNPEELWNDAQIGGLRNYGFGQIQVEDYRSIDLDELETPEEVTSVELVTPLCIESEATGTTDYEGLPSFMDASRYREREEKILVAGEDRWLNLVDHGQVFGFGGSPSRVRGTALKGVTRILNHKKYGYGEFMVR